VSDVRNWLELQRGTLEGVLIVDVLPHELARVGERGGADRRQFNRLGAVEEAVEEQDGLLRLGKHRYSLGRGAVSGDEASETV
jgi:hypothetical protein